jgi:hypothetical protein
MTPDELITLALDNIRLGLRHAHYPRAMEVKAFATAMITGKGQDDLITRYRIYENDELKRQRIRLTNTPTAALLAGPRKYWKRIWNVEGVNTKIESPNTAKLAKLTKQFSNVEEGRGLDAYLNYKLEYLGVTDPNAWIFWERRDRRSPDNAIIETHVYPVIVPTENVLNFSRQYGETQWVLYQSPYLEVDVVNGAQIETWRTDYYLYAPGFVVQLLEVSRKTQSVPASAPGRVAYNVYDLQVADAIVTEQYIAPGMKADLTEGNPNKRYFVSVYANGTSEVPGNVVGVYADEETMQQTYCTWFEPGREVLLDALRDKSIEDVTKVVHAYLKRKEFVPACDHKDADGSECTRGYYNGDPHRMCGQCGGTGKMPSFSTEQQVQEIGLPRNTKPQDLIDLSKLSFTEELQVDFLEFISAAFEKSEKRLMKTILTPGILERSVTDTGDKTATEVNREYEGLNYVLAPFASGIDRHYELAYRIGAQYLEFPLTACDRRTPQDLRLELLSDLLATLEAMDKASVSFDIKRPLIERIIAKQNEDDSGRVSAIVAKYKFMPFADKSDEEVMFILASRSPLDSQRVLWENHYEIFQEIEAENPKPPFYTLAYDRQKLLVAKKVEDFKTRITTMGGDSEGGFGIEQAIGKIPLGLQQLGLAQGRLRESGLNDVADVVVSKMKDLAGKINANAFDAVPGLGEDVTDVVPNPNDIPVS